MHSKRCKGFFPPHEKNRMKHEGDVKAARESFFATKNKILYHLVKQRYEWMNKYIHEGDMSIIELGCGAGLSKQFIANKNLLLTDIVENEWVDRKVDALNIDYPDNSLDAIICCHMLHHLANPAKFFDDVSKKLKPGGRIIIQDIYTGTFMKLVLRVMRHEGYSDYVDVFDRNEICNLPEDPWSANCSIPKLLFFSSSKDEFEQRFPMYKMKKRERNECFLFLLSGGVIAKTFYLPVREKGVKIIQKIDKLLVKRWPNTFANGCSVVLEKVLKP